MNKQEDICAKCVHDEPGYQSVLDTIDHCCEKHWSCKPGGEAKYFEPKGEQE